MAFSLRTLMLTIGLSSLWLGAIVTRSPVLLEVASVSSLLLLFLAIPLCFYDHPHRQSFWAGFSAIGIGLMMAATFFDLPIHKTCNAITGIAMTLPGISDLPDSITTEVVPVSFYPQGGEPRQATMQTLKTKLSVHEAISGSVPFLLIMLLATLGGLFVQHSASKTHANAG